MTPSSKDSRPMRDRLATEMEAAFVSNDAVEAGALTPLPAIDRDLLQTVPVPAPLDFENLEEEVTRQRRLVVRAAVGIPIAGVLAIGGSLLIHALLVGTFLASFYLFLHAPHHGGGSANADDADMGGGSNGGTLFITDVAALAQGNPGKVAATPIAQAPITPPVKETPPPAAPPKVPPVAPPPVLPPPQIAMNITPQLPNTPDIIGLPAGPDALGTIHLPPSKPAPPVAPPPTEIGLPIAAPPQTALLATPEHSTGDVPKFGSTNGTAARTSSPRRGPDDGLDDNDDEETISLMNPGHGGGHGSGSGKRGNGIDRGGYGGGDLDAKVRDLAKLNYDGPPPKQAVTLHVIVHADGTVGKITVSESSGNDDYDEACVEAARESQYTPQRVDGKYVEGSADITLGTLLK